MAAVAILIPLMRPHKIAPLVQNIQETTNDANIVVVATGECAEAARDLPVTLVEDEGGSYAARVNRGFRACQEPYVFLGADDIWFHPGWFEQAMTVMNQIDGTVSVNDGYTNVHFLVSRQYVMDCGAVLDSPGDVMAECYTHAFSDDELRATARYHNRYEHCPQAIIEHQHCGNGKSPHDEIYHRGEASMMEGHSIFQSRAHLWGC